MEYVSTRGSNKVDFVEAIHLGLAHDGGLLVPNVFPNLQQRMLETAHLPLPDFANVVLQPFVESSALEASLEHICQHAFSFPVRTKKLSDSLTVLELFHGPTLSFKDVGARFLAQCLSQIKEPRCILVATSGDTGSAVASAFSNLQNTNVVILYPKGKISPRQQAQITCWGKNILALGVNGVFDDCQRLVKQAFTDQAIKEQYHLTTANSINIGRLLPQMTYFAHQASLYFLATGTPINYIIPSGNLGHVTACCYAKQLGAPIAQVTVATNENRTFPEYLHTGRYFPKATVKTLANAMDVGAPSNFERLSHHFPSHADVLAHVSAFAVSDDQIKQAIIGAYREHGYLLCPHTATAYHVAHKLQPNEQCLVATAHPAKFEDVIEALIDEPVPVPAHLQRLLDKFQQVHEVEPTLAAILDVMTQYW